MEEDSFVLPCAGSARDYGQRFDRDVELLNEIWGQILPPEARPADDVTPFISFSRSFPSIPDRFVSQSATRQLSITGQYLGHRQLAKGLASGSAGKVWSASSNYRPPSLLQISACEPRLDGEKCQGPAASAALPQGLIELASVSRRLGLPRLSAALQSVYGKSFHYLRSGHVDGKPDVSQLGFYDDVKQRCRVGIPSVIVVGARSGGLVPIYYLLSSLVKETSVVTSSSQPAIDISHFLPPGDVNVFRLLPGVVPYHVAEYDTKRRAQFAYSQNSLIPAIIDLLHVPTAHVEEVKFIVAPQNLHPRPYIFLVGEVTEAVSATVGRLGFGRPMTVDQLRSFTFEADLGQEAVSSSMNIFSSPVSIGTTRKNDLLSEGPRRAIYGRPHQLFTHICSSVTGKVTVCDKSNSSASPSPIQVYEGSQSTQLRGSEGVDSWRADPIAMRQRLYGRLLCSTANQECSLSASEHTAIQSDTSFQGNRNEVDIVQSIRARVYESLSCVNSIYFPTQCNSSLPYCDQGSDTEIMRSGDELDRGEISSGLSRTLAVASSCAALGMRNKLCSEYSAKGRIHPDQAIANWAIRAVENQAFRNTLVIMPDQDAVDAFRRAMERVAHGRIEGRVHVFFATYSVLGQFVPCEAPQGASRLNGTIPPLKCIPDQILLAISPMTSWEDLLSMGAWCDAISLKCFKWRNLSGPRCSPRLRATVQRMQALYHPPSTILRSNRDNYYKRTVGLMEPPDISPPLQDEVPPIRNTDYFTRSILAQKLQVVRCEKEKREQSKFRMAQGCVMTAGALWTVVEDEIISRMIQQPGATFGDVVAALDASSHATGRTYTDDQIHRRIMQMRTSGKCGDSVGPVALGACLAYLVSSFLHSKSGTEPASEQQPASQLDSWDIRGIEKFFVKI